ncbi:type III restriction-modification system endonuclease [Syntrophomonas wolfei]|uniref:Type III restriction system endonuclease n=1 Tax=Syntrophomonas wolfei subsp. wolfei (strain DSM 2245B / Goettingen) TaxID=335541 RepID=Q0AWQ4_SYNWW|nr:DEAD/DEAH box helicase family protein [Syntrophomonas wolfei]ABI68850.1 type III restriction system endonuclease [Syntrophomonas wolfei subsp. wolfei str. Goettingen G311]
MKLKFVSDQQFQLDAVASISDIFQGQAVKQANFSVASTMGSSAQGELGYQTELGYANKLDLLDDELLENINRIQLRNGLPKSTDIQGRNFTVEMETGTGKTYVYIRTIYELNKLYGFTKFIIVVPSVAIREGVNKSLEIMEEHFKSLYEGANCDYFIYDSSKLGQLRTFATSSNIQIMVINIDAFRKSFVDPNKPDKANIIHREHDRMNGRRPIEFIQQTNPIVIIDEPQSVDRTDKAKEAIASLNPLCTLRYSATHVETYNLMYCLGPVDAYQKKLVKEIVVDSIKEAGNFNRPYIRLVSVKNSNGFQAVLELDIKNRSGVVQRKQKTVRVGQDLFDISGEREIYSGYIINNIDCYPGNEMVEFTNGSHLPLGMEMGNISGDDIKRGQISATIKHHLDRELRLVPQGIKVLSLFFIDRVDNYRIYDSNGNPQKGKYALMFEEEYSKLIKLPKYRTLFEDHNYMLNDDPSMVHDGYFSIDKKGRIKDTRGNTLADHDTYNLIMKEKEKLLSFETPLRFIFSHSALKEGWDNPNVFQICTLIEARETLTRRQKIGRGLRLCVNQEGERIFDPQINTLSVMANESFAEFAENLQSEMEAETGVKFGFIEKHAFAGISYTDDSGKIENLGYEASENLWGFLLEEDLIYTTGKVKLELKEQIANDTFQVPPEFEHVEQEIKQVIRQSLNKLPIRNHNNEVTAQLNKRVYLGPEFESLWNRIKFRTTYSVAMDIEKLVQECVDAINRMPAIPKVRLIQESARIDINQSGVSGELTSVKVLDQIDIKHSLPDILRYLQDETRLTRRTIVRILIEARRLEDFKNNPQKFMEAVSDIIKQRMKLMIADGIKYERVGNLEFYRQELFEMQELKGYLKSNAIKVEKSVYDYLILDSNTEKEFAQMLEQDDEVKVYTKLPPKFVIETPIGNYNPDWAVLVDKDGTEKLYFVVETKGSTDSGQLRLFENYKIECGKKHFAALETGVTYEVAKDYAEWKLGI